ncbi:hypothetical protein LLE49_19295 [Alicyclobacillus tolerans]|nr:hypothetical protein [Alicyclobacillus tolerans]MCF8566870.1 hypothetical protein [Alicyclobacillus tolerans]
MEDIPLDLLHHYQDQGLSEAQMAVEYIKYKNAVYEDAMADPDRLDHTKPNQSVDNPSIPAWATSKDKLDFKKMLEEDAPVMFDGVPLDDEDKEKVLRVMEAVFWDAKKKNKRKPIDE